MAVVAWLMGIGIVWGATNALMKWGALIAAEEKRRRRRRRRRSTSSSSSSSKKTTPATLVWSLLQEWVQRLRVWEYCLPFLLNLSLLVLFVIKLGDSPITLAVPVTNSTTFWCHGHSWCCSWREDEGAGDPDWSVSHHCRSHSLHLASSLLLRLNLFLKLLEFQTLE